MAKKQITIPFFIPHMGCPQRCAFCSQWQVSGAASVPEPEDIPRRIAEWTRSASSSIKHKEAAFFGGSFTGLPRDLQVRYLKEARGQKDAGAINAIRLSTRPDYIDEESISLLLEYSVDTVELGAQSFNDDILTRSRRGHSADDIRTAAKLINARGLNLVIQLMPGLPGDTREISLESARSALRLKPSAVRLYPTVVLADTELEKMMKAKNFTPLTLEEAVEWGADQLALFHEASIPVIRIGLHPFSPEQELKIIAGPYSTSLGFMVKARYRRRLLMKHFEGLERSPEGTDIEVQVPDHQLPEYIGHRRENILFIKEHFKLHSFAIVPGTENKIPVV